MILQQPRKRITKRHKHDWVVPVGYVPRVFGLEGTARCSKCDMRVTVDDPAYDGLVPSYDQ